MGSSPTEISTRGTLYGGKYGGNLYEGQWKEGKPHGHGKLTNAKNAVDEGNWRQGEFVDEKDVD